MDLGTERYFLLYCHSSAATYISSKLNLCTTSKASKQAREKGRRGGRAGGGRRSFPPLLMSLRITRGRFSGLPPNVTFCHEKPYSTWMGERNALAEGHINSTQ